MSSDVNMFNYAFTYNIYQNSYSCKSFHKSFNKTTREQNVVISTYIDRDDIDDC